MAGKISRNTQHKVDILLGCLDRITANAGRLSEASLTELFRRAAIPSRPDGYPRSTALDSGGSSKDKWAPTSVEGSVLAREKEHNDLVKAQAQRIEHLIQQADTYLQGVFTGLEYIQFKVDEGRERKARSSACEICATLPADPDGTRAVLPVDKAGYCTLHYNDWWKHGKPDRTLWRLFKCQIRNSEGLLLVDQCPPNDPHSKAIRGPWAA